MIKKEKTNRSTVTIKLERREIIRTLIAITAAQEALKKNGEYAETMKILHDKIKKQLDNFDAE